MATKKKPAAKKTPVKKAAPKKTHKPAHSREDQVAATALKLVDEAAALLRKGIVSGSKTTEKAREEAKKEAHKLLNKASSSLSEIVTGSASTLRKVINKL